MNSRKNKPCDTLRTALVANPDHIRLAMLGMVDANGHPFSWSVIINGKYHAEPVVEGGYKVITDYLDRQPPTALGIPGAEVTHAWCEDPVFAKRVSASAAISHIVSKPEDVIGHVDAIIIPTDIGAEHVERVRPFLEAGLPVFIDKPLTDNRAGLGQFERWHKDGCAFMSTSCMRYSAEFEVLRTQLDQVGDVRAIVVTMAKSWERYGIHALEAVYGLLPAGGYQWVVNTGSREANVVHLKHSTGVDVILIVADDLYGGMGHVHVTGTRDTIRASFSDSFTAFKRQLEAYISYLRTGVSPVSWAQTREQMAILIAAIESRESGGSKVVIDSILADIEAPGPRDVTHNSIDP